MKRWRGSKRDGAECPISLKLHLLLLSLWSVRTSRTWERADRPHSRPCREPCPPSSRSSGSPCTGRRFRCASLGSREVSWRRWCYEEQNAAAPTTDRWLGNKLGRSRSGLVPTSTQQCSNPETTATTKNYPWGNFGQYSRRRALEGSEESRWIWYSRALEEASLLVASWF